MRGLPARDPGEESEHETAGEPAGQGRHPTPFLQCSPDPRVRRRRAPGRQAQKRPRRVHASRGGRPPVKRSRSRRYDAGVESAGIQSTYDGRRVHARETSVDPGPQAGIRWSRSGARVIRDVPQRSSRVSGRYLTCLGS